MRVRKIRLDDDVTFLVEFLEGEHAGKWGSQWAGCLEGPHEGMADLFPDTVPGQRLYDLAVARSEAPYEEWVYTELHDFDDGLGPRELFDDEDHAQPV
jgi:hypothetical protein